MNIQAILDKIPIFCYGSNGVEQLRERCKNYSLLSVPGILPNYLRCFGSKSKRWNNGAVSTVVEKKGESTIGTIIYLTEDELKLLDPFEGCDSQKPESLENIYRRVKVEMKEILMESNQKLDINNINNYTVKIIEGYVYIKNNHDWIVEPDALYLNAIQKHLTQFWKNYKGEFKLPILKAEDKQHIKDWILN